MCPCGGPAGVPFPFRALSSSRLWRIRPQGATGRLYRDSRLTPNPSTARAADRTRWPGQRQASAAAPCCRTGIVRLFDNKRSRRKSHPKTRDKMRGLAMRFARRRYPDFGPPSPFFCAACLSTHRPQPLAKSHRSPGRGPHGAPVGKNLGRAGIGRQRERKCVLCANCCPKRQQGWFSGSTLGLGSLAVGPSRPSR